MARFSPREARVRIGEHHGRLTVRWTVADSWTFEDVKSSFRSTFGRHSQACWNGALKAWTLPHWQYDALCWWVAQTFTRAAVTWFDDDEEPSYQHRRTSGRGAAHNQAHTPDPERDAYARLHLLPTAPPELVDAAYRTLARLHHPDHGGDTATMTAINEAAALLREARHARAS